MTDPVVEFLSKHGEAPVSLMRISNYSLAALKTRVIVLYKLGVLIRRSEPIREGAPRNHWVYSLSGISPKHKTQNDKLFERLKLSALKNEPDYAYHLRNLPRNEACK